MLGDCKVNKIRKSSAQCQRFVCQLLELAIIVGEGEHAPAAASCVIDTLKQGVIYRFVSHHQQRLSSSHVA